MIFERLGIFGLTLFFAKACASGGEIDGWRWLHWICKPLATVAILWQVWHAHWPVSARYRRWMAAGMVFSLAGDVFLMLPQDAFVPGLVSFLLAHLCFILAFLDDSGFAERPWGMLACVAYGLFNLWALWPSLPPALQCPGGGEYTDHATASGRGGGLDRRLHADDGPVRVVAPRTYCSVAW